MSEKKQYCFGLEKKRYQTKGINSRMPMEYRMIMWMWIDELVKEHGNADYLQVFNFSVGTENGKKYQYIEHIQETPEYQEVYRMDLLDEEAEGIEGKVFVIDDGEQCTMLWAEEY